MNPSETLAILRWLENNKMFQAASVLETESGVTLHKYGNNLKSIRDLAFQGEFDELVSLATQLFKDDAGSVVLQIREVQFSELLAQVNSEETLERAGNFLASIKDSINPADFKRMVFNLSNPPSKFNFARHKIAELFISKIAPSFPEESPSKENVPSLVFGNLEPIFGRAKQNLSKTTALMSLRENQPQLSEVTRCDEKVAVRACTFLDDGKIIFGNNRGTVFTRDKNFAEIHRQPGRHEGSVFCLRSCGAIWASGSNDQSVKISGASEIEIPINSGTVRCLAFTDGDRLFTASSEESVFREFSGEGVLKGFVPLGSYAKSLEAVSFNELVAVSSMGVVHLWDTRQSRATVSFRSSRGKANFACGRDGLVFVGSDSGSLEAFDARKMPAELWFKENAHSGEIRSISATDKFIASTAFDGTVLVSTAGLGDETDRVTLGGKVVNCSWLGRRLTVTSAEGVCVLYELN